MSLVVSPKTAARMYVQRPVRAPRARRMRLTPELLEMLPDELVREVRRRLHSGVEAFLEDDERGLAVLIRNKR